MDSAYWYKMAFCHFNLLKTGYSAQLQATGNGVTAEPGATGNL